MRMGNHICMPLFNSKANSDARIADSSILLTQVPPPSPMLIYREPSLHRTSNHTLRRTEITANGVIFRSMEDLHEEVVRQLTIHMPRR
uniref:AC4 protein n=1 Tax=Sida golden mosaic Brazil virus TaxID=2080282 RepID=A0A6B9KDY1_9GEMI|nr:AC4 protein [Sida golden mosaic Brazil virus]